MSWEELRSIRAAQALADEEFLSTPPTHCPNDGTTLQTGPNGELHCVFDGWIWSGNYRDKMD